MLNWLLNISTGLVRWAMLLRGLIYVLPGMKYIRVQWRPAAGNMPPTIMEKLGTLADIRAKALNSNTVHMRTRHGITQWLRKRMDNDYVWMVKRGIDPDGTDHIIIAPDYNAARSEALRQKEG